MTVNVIEIGKNPMDLIEQDGHIKCDIPDAIWKNYTMQNSRMPSDEYFQYVLFELF